MKARGQLIELLRRSGLLSPAYRAYESFAAARHDVARGVTQPAAVASKDLPIPPTKLIVLVSGNPDAGRFLEDGQAAAQTIRELLSGNGVDIERLDVILDFGCGCGRVMRHWQSLRNCQLHGCDQNPDLVGWCSAYLPFAQFAVNAMAPPLSYADERFNLVYALSVFTHLPEALQLAWASETARILKPGGYWVLTTHGASYLNRLTEAERDAFLDDKLVTRFQEAAGSNLCATFHPRPYVVETLARGFEEVDFIAEGARGNPHQDIYLFQKPL